MNAPRAVSPQVEIPTITANDRLKRRAALWEANALVVAVMAHFALLALWPAMTAGGPPTVPTDLQVLAIPEVEIPPAPEPIRRLAEPVISSTPIDPSITIADNVRFDFPPEGIAPPKAAREDDAGPKYIHIMPQMVPPRVLNQQDVERALTRNYPSLLRDAGIGGLVEVLLWLDETGTIVRAEIGRSSGREALDQAALKVVDVMKLTPALNQSRPTRVIVTIPIQFVAH